MTNLHEVIEQNNTAANYVVRAPGPIDHLTAELILRNTAVAADRITAQQFMRLGDPAVEAMTYAAEAAKQLSPLEKEDMMKIPRETGADYSHRINIWQPLQRFQSKVSAGEFADDDHTTQRLKAAVWLGNVAFQRVLTDPVAQSFTELQRTIGYFGGNSGAAVRGIR